jgi:hypothetical protein
MEKIKPYLLDFRKSFFREKYRFDQGNAFLIFVNFALLVANMVTMNGGNVSNTKFFIVLGLGGTWLLGYFLDRIVKVQEIQEKTTLSRSPLWQDNFTDHENQNEKLERLIERLEKVESKLHKAD